MNQPPLSHVHEALAQSLAAPRYHSVGRDEHEYLSYSMNHDYASERPVVVYFGLGTTALTAMGRAYLYEYMSALERPIVTLRPLTRRWQGVADRAEVDATLLENMYDRDMDIVGASSGGLVASHVAASLGEAARHLVTVSSVGTKRGYAAYMKGLPGQFIAGLRESARMTRRHDTVPIIGARASHFFAMSHYGDLLQTVRASVAASLEVPIMQLHEQTKWHDIIGTKDNMTDYRDHLLLVAQRNQVLPHSATIDVMPGEAHMWATKRALLAEKVRDAVS